MRELVVISGKGGTGKTTIVGSFAVLADGKVLADADVDAPNLHLLLSPESLTSEAYRGSQLAVRDNALCVRCRRCQQVCEFSAVTEEGIDARRCEGCGTCAVVCPVGAISLLEQVTGQVHVGATRHGTLVYARLAPGAEATGKLVARVREVAQERAREEGADLLLVDGSPGIGCPVIASLTGVDAALAVTEPTPSGLHDLRRVLQLAVHFRVSTAVAVNKWDLNEELAVEIEDVARELGATPLGRIPFDEAVADATAEGVPVVEWGAGPAARAVAALWEALAPICR